MKKTIVISAVNLNHGGTLTILRDCLSFLSEYASQANLRVIAIVFDKELAYYPNIEYIENRWPKKRWVNRLWFEYISLRKVSKKIGEIDLWFSLHDTTPNVIAKRRAVYCHSPFAFYKPKFQELFYTPKIVLFSWFTKYIYKLNQANNDYIVVQQKWFKQAMMDMFNIISSKIIIAPPEAPRVKTLVENENLPKYSFLFAASPNSHKNFEVLCRATEILEKRNIYNFNVYITLLGDENKYSNWIYKKWGHLKSLNFIGFLNKEDLYSYYESVQCLVFPSKIETWGLPISEFSIYDKPMLLANLPYARETASGADKVAFFDPNSGQDLAGKMEDLINGFYTILNKLPVIEYDEPKAYDWKRLFELLLKEK